MKSVVQEASTLGKAIEQGWKAAGEPREFSIKVLETPQHNFLGFTTKSAKIAIVFEESAPREGYQRERRDTRDRDQRPRDSRRDGRDNRERDTRSRDGRSRDTSSRTDSRPERPYRDRERDSSHTRDRRDRFRDRGEQGREQDRDQREKRHFSQQPPITEPADFGDIELKTVVSPTPPPQPSIVAEALAPQQNQANKQLGQWDDELINSAKKWLTETLQHMGLSSITFTVEPQNFHLRITLSKPLIEDEVKEKHLFASLSTLMIASLKKEFRKALRGHKIVIVHG